MLPIGIGPNAIVVDDIKDGGTGPDVVPVQFPVEGGGNYYSFNKADLQTETVAIHACISADKVLGWYNEISKDDLSAQSGVILNFLPSWVGVAWDALQWANDQVSAGCTDRNGNILYIESGYTIVVLSRVYYSIEDRYSAAENEYFVYNQKLELVYNDTVIISHFVG